MAPTSLGPSKLVLDMGNLKPLRVFSFSFIRFKFSITYNKHKAQYFEKEKKK